MTGQKIRIYDLAKELKLDNKKVLEDARREGVDVSVPSNTVPADVADRIRAKYFPKKALPTAGPRLVKVIKKAAPEKSAEELSAEEAAQEESQQETGSQPKVHHPVERPTQPTKVEPPKPTVRVLNKKAEVQSQAQQTEQIQ